MTWGSESKAWDESKEIERHATAIFPEATNLTCTLAAHANAHTWSGWVEIDDSAATDLTSKFTANGYITAMLVEDTNQADAEFMVEVSYGDSHTIVSRFRVLTETNHIPTAQSPRVRGDEIPTGETIYYQAMCSVAGSKELYVHFRYYLETGAIGSGSESEAWDESEEIHRHSTAIFPEATNLTCTLTAGAANNWSGWVEIDDSALTTLTSRFTASGYIAAMLVESSDTASVIYMVEVAYGASYTIVSRFRVLTETNHIPTAQSPRVRGAEIPAGETIYYREMCATGGAKLYVHFRYYLEE